MTAAVFPAVVLYYPEDTKPESYKHRNVLDPRKHYIVRNPVTGRHTWVRRIDVVDVVNDVATVVIRGIREATGGTKRAQRVIINPATGDRLVVKLKHLKDLK